MKKIDKLVTAPHFYTMEGEGVGYSHIEDYSGYGNGKHVLAGQSSEQETYTMEGEGVGYRATSAMAINCGKILEVIVAQGSGARPDGLQNGHPAARVPLLVGYGVVKGLHAEHHPVVGVLSQTTIMRGAESKFCLDPSERILSVLKCS